jgi:3-deoxy-D-manno-octulosonic-acid transferase
MENGTPRYFLKLITKAFPSRLLSDPPGYFKSRPGLFITMSYLSQSLSLFLPGFTRSFWFHGRSPEQFEAAIPLIDRLRKEAPQIRFVFTADNLLPYEWLKEKFSTDTVFPLPLPLKFIVARFFTSTSPEIIFLLESDLGVSPRILLTAAGKKVPIVILNVSTDHKNPAASFKAHRLARTSITLACIQKKRAAEMLRQMGIIAERTAVTGNLCFDYTPPTAETNADYLRDQLGLEPQQSVLLAERIQLSENSMLADAFRKVKNIHSSAVLLLETSNRYNMSETMSEYKRDGLSVCYATQAKDTRDKDVVLFNRPGDTGNFYKVAACVVSGSSFSGRPNPVNPIGPALHGKTVIYGPKLPAGHIASLFVRHQAALQVDPPELYPGILKFIDSAGHATAFTSNAMCIIEKNRGATDKTYRAIEPLMPSVPETPLIETSWRIGTIRDRFGSSSLWRHASRPLKKGRINTWDSLYARLGKPETILCLGNGPSSEDPQVIETKHDCLFRVNWRWKSRAILTDPAVVFVGDPQTVHRLSSCVFGFWNTRLEDGMLLRYFITHGVKLMKYFTVERLSPIIRDRKWPARPTNGVLMIVSAAALNPRQIIIAGMDLYQHPDGRYPGDLLSNNRYSQVHHPDTELEIMKRALKKYRGNLRIIGAPLKEALKGLL